MTEDIFILDCHSDIFVWVGQQVNSKDRMHALAIGEVWLFRICLDAMLYFGSSASEQNTNLSLPFILMCTVHREMETHKSISIFYVY